MPRFNLKEAVAKHSRVTEKPVDMTFAELVDGYCKLHNDGVDMMLRKWRDLFEGRSAWSIERREIALGMRAMQDAGYKNSTVNRDVSAIGSIYKWARRKHLSPANFVSPIVGLERLPEPVREVFLSPEE